MDRLLDAAVALAGDRPLSSLSVDEIVREAGVAKGTFYVHFTDRHAFMVALHARFDRLLARIVAEATAGMAPGRERFLAGSLASLDACRTHEGLKSVLIETRLDPAVANATGRRNDRFARAASDDLAAMGVDPPLPAARLLVAMVAEAALMETELGGPADDVRAALAAVVGAR